MSRKTKQDPQEKNIVVCASANSKETRQAGWSDNVRGHCAECAEEIIWRPHVPEPSIKLCLECGLRSMNEAEKNGEQLKFATNQQQRMELEEKHGPGAVEKGWALIETMRKLEALRTAMKENGLWHVPNKEAGRHD